MNPTAFTPGPQTLTFNPLEKKIRVNREIDTRTRTNVVPSQQGSTITFDGAGNVSYKQSAHSICSASSKLHTVRAYHRGSDQQIHSPLHTL